ncbi:MAG TPA: glycoside hydrolase family 127 protein, partial [Thermoguttaceae bacterium]|nr:glycoside hydrolase family 127 protein [Thermoguttaceae bacterium]
MFICSFFRVRTGLGQDAPNRFVCPGIHVAQAAAIGMMICFGSWLRGAEVPERKPGELAITVVEAPPIEERNPFYVSNRPPLAPSPLIKLPIGSITPMGWLRQMLLLERNGMTGRLKEISPWLRFEESAWANKEGQGKHGWEEMPYWLKGFGDLGYVLEDQEVIAEARKWIEAAMASQREDGWFGPRGLLTALDGKPDLWPHMVMLNVLQSYYEYSGDRRVLDVITRYFQWQNRLP